MKAFQLHERVRVKDRHLSIEKHTGTVIRLRRTDTRAWIEMDGELPADLRTFPIEDPRARHVLLHPTQCGPILRKGTNALDRQRVGAR